MTTTNPLANITQVPVLPVIGHGYNKPTQEIPFASKVDKLPLIEKQKPCDEFSWSDKYTKYLFPLQIVVFIAFLVAAVIMI